MERELDERIDPCIFGENWVATFKNFKTACAFWRSLNVRIPKRYVPAELFFVKILSSSDRGETTIVEKLIPKNWKKFNYLPFFIFITFHRSMRFYFFSAPRKIESFSPFFQNLSKWNYLFQLCRKTNNCWEKSPVIKEPAILSKKLCFLLLKNRRVRTSVWKNVKLWLATGFESATSQPRKMKKLTTELNIFNFFSTENGKTDKMSFLPENRPCSIMVIMVRSFVIKYYHSNNINLIYVKITHKPNFLYSCFGVWNFGRLRVLEFAIVQKFTSSLRKHAASERFSNILKNTLHVKFIEPVFFIFVYLVLNIWINSRHRRTIRHILGEAVDA